MEPPIKIPFLNKSEKGGELSSGSGSLEFSVRVEVEDIDTLPEEDPSNYMKYLFSLSQDSKQEVNEDELDKRILDLGRTFIMDPQKIYRTFRGLLKKYPHEKEAVIHTRNAWGKVFHEKSVEEPSIHPQSVELQDILTQWKNWLNNSRVKETPFCYKCYICSDAWWTLMDFKNHIRAHEDCSIRLEIIQHECNIIAHEGQIPEPNDIHIDGKCFKCAKTFKQHLDCRKFTDHRYFCTHCKDEFITCRLLNSHEGICDKNPVRTTVISDDIMTNQDTFTEYPCKICGTIFVTVPERCEHMNVCHRVRSDEPIITHGKICRVCNKTFHIFSFHVCEKKNIIHECIHCHGKFQNRQMLEAHLAMWDKPFVCTICDKFVKRQCMGAEHYAKHSDNFLIMYRCLLCAKIKLFYNDDAFRNHRTKTHRRVDNRRPIWDKIIVPKIMLEQCLFIPKSQRKSNTKKTKFIVPVKADTRTTDNINDRRKTNSTETQENEESNSTAANDNDSILSEDTQIPEDSKDFLKTLTQITETLDIKPDIVVKDEKLSDTEDSKADLVEIIAQTQKEQAKSKADVPLAVREQSNKFKQIIQEVEEIKLSNIFQVSKNAQPVTPIKQEIKEEPEEFEDDLIVLESSSESIKQESESSDMSLLNLEPEVILKAGYRKRKTYKCNKCCFEGYHREYREHVNNHCRTPPKRKSEPTEDNFTCTKCKNSFDTLKSYALHFVQHKYKFMTCPQCVTMFDSVTKLVTHINTHVKNQFVRMQLIQRAEDVDKSKMCQCKTCKEVIDIKSTFAHWEGHLEIKTEPEKNKCMTINKMSTGNESALEPDELKRILDIFQNQDGVTKGVPNKIKCCFVCKRYFDRQNDCKRHLVEHLLEDAYASVYRTEFLKCQICHELHKKADSYKKHMRDHASLPIYQCGLCNKTFSDSSNFTKHKKVHNLKVFVCDICNKKFQAKFSLEKHMEMHMTTEPFHCEPCQRVFYDHSFFRRHVRQHHDGRFARFACMICKKRFESLRLKWDHMWEEHKQRKEKADCPICKKSYRKISDVKKHSLTEHGFNISLANVFKLVDEYHSECDKVVESLKVNEQEREASSDDDVLLIEEDRETLIIYDD
ncbi:uncharacterized protein isoform X2 [Choristoneura fumiferana]|uniref:uncharacterized protein isoform X2 n=1 Tax=Choristoneura fumiferana TaxID=7141 RepID=UPI003D158F9C